MIHKPYPLILLWILLSVHTKVECKIRDDSGPRLTFSRFSMAYLTGRQNSLNRGVETLGHGAGIEILINPPYGDEDEDLVIGWTWNNRIGWNFTKGNLCSFGEDIGFWGAKRIGSNMEAGMQYSFIGYNVYQNISFFGSKIQGAFRWKNLQFTYTREGAGVFYGCIKTKYGKDMSNVHGLELAYLTKKGIFGSLRNVYYRMGENKTAETHISIGIAM